jgi:hypothetical protein
MTVDGMQGNAGVVYYCWITCQRQSVYFYWNHCNIADANPTDLLYTDQLKFDSGADLQTVELLH